MFYYDDSGWLLNDMMTEYTQTHTASLLKNSETIFSFLKTGWLKSGGEEFYKDCGCVEQVATRALRGTAKATIPVINSLWPSPRSISDPLSYLYA
jgi:hypothetical protein